MVMLYDVNVSSKSTLRVLCSGGLDNVWPAFNRKLSIMFTHVGSQTTHTHTEDNIESADVSTGNVSTPTLSTAAWSLRERGRGALRR